MAASCARARTAGPPKHETPKASTGQAKAVLKFGLNTSIGFREPDPLCDLDVVPNEARSLAMNAAISNSFGFGGLNAVLAAKRV
jgi:3-oxoacyl-(acyl-carrier-protein) synthase